MVRALLLALLISWSSYLWGEDNSSWKAGFFTGPYLPSLLPGVEEVMKTYGGRMGYYADGFGVEVGGFRSVEDGAIINYAFGSLLKEFPIPQVDFLKVHLTLGLQTSYYRPASTNGSAPEFARGSGIHLGGGGTFPLNPRTAIRAQYMVLNGPGRALLVEVGMEFALGDVATSQK